MSDWPDVSFPPCVTITPWSMESIGVALQTGLAEGLSTTTSAGWVAANRAIYIPFSIAERITVVKMFCFNGATASNNIDVGIYSDDFTRLVSSGSTAQAGTTTIQEFDVTDTQLTPGRYYLAMAMDGTTGTVHRIATSLARQRQAGVQQQAAAFALPANGTPAVLANAFIPLVGLTIRSVV